MIFVFVMTKIDIVIPKKLNQNIRNIKKMMKRTGKHVYEIKEEFNIKIAFKKMSENFIHLFQISNVKGNDISPPFHYLTDFLNMLNINQTILDDKKRTENFICYRQII